MDTSKKYIEMCECVEIQQHQFDCGPTFHFAYNFDGIWHIHYDVLGGQDDKKVWLPRQDQIQEMLKEEFEKLFNTYYSIYGLFHFFSIFYDRPDTLNKFDSGEKLWLAFYMYNKHIKKWDGKKWIT